MSITVISQSKALPDFQRGDGFFPRSFMDLWSRGILSTVPLVNIIETRFAYRIEMAIPGMRQEEFYIDLDDEVITIACGKHEEKEKNPNERFSRREYSYEGFSRSFTLPEDANPSALEADYVNGILCVSIARSGSRQFS